MTIVVFDGKSYECARAVKGVDYINLYDANDNSIVSFKGISDFSAFTLQEGTWEQSVCTDIVGANSELIDRNIKLKLIGSTVIETGLTITFKAPCNCTQAGNIIIQDKTFSMVNAVGVPIASNFEAFKSEALVTIVLSLEDSKAYIQNADASLIENGGTGAATLDEAKAILGIPTIISGTYTGDGNESQFIDLGFTPSAVVITRKDGATYTTYANEATLWGGIATKDSPCAWWHATEQKDYPTITIENGGFRVYKSTPYGTVHIQTNDNYHYNYIAYK